MLERKKVLSGNDSAKPEQESGAKANEAGHESPEDGERDKDEPSDAVLNLELAELVAQQALNAPEIHNKNELLFELWRVADEFGEQSKRLEVMLYEKLWTDANLCEESFIAKYEKHSNDANAFDILDESVRRFETLKMFRYYIDVCEKRISNDDVFANAKLYDVYKLMDEKNLATVDDYKKLLEFESDDEVSERIVRRALQRFGDSSFLWTYLIQLKVDSGNASKKDIQKLFNDAEHAVSLLLLFSITLLH
ncbi:unnamed protein product [Anisakis simplex]|uniref:Uncharacterized protein n=1 Tax=Anisakis simplex TaxID=6269 RepID=A0A3P6N9K8_ANISI|nr:unnamed protein product [Anisakis simplex]